MSASQPEEFAPEFLTIGHATRDLLPGGEWRLGGTVTFAALTAQRLGLRAAIVTSGPPDLLAALREALPGVAIAAIPAAEATTFENLYFDSARRQYLRGRAAPLTPAAIPAAWLSAPLVLLAPVAREVDPALATRFPHALVAATPQGWLRRWNTSGSVTPGPLAEAAEALPHLRALILSRDDLLPPPAPTPTPSAPGEAPAASRADLESAADAQIAAWARIVSHVVVTRGSAGAVLLREGGAPEAFPGYPAHEVDPTGAGDVFAAAFLCHLHAVGDPSAATDFANRVAAASIERVGVAAIPTLDELAVRFPPR